MESYSKYIWIAALIAFGFLLVYKILPRLFKNYEAEKGAKILILYLMMGYLCYDFFMKEKYAYVGIFIVGTIAFTVMIISAKRRDQ